MMAIVGDRGSDGTRHVETKPLHKAVDDFARRTVAFHQCNARNVLVLIGQDFAILNRETGGYVMCWSVILDNADHGCRDRLRSGRTYAEVVRRHGMSQPDRMLNFIRIAIVR